MVGAVLNVWIKPSRMSSIHKHQSQVALASIQKKLVKLAQPPQQRIEVYDAVERVKVKQEYSSAYRELKSAVAKLLHLIPTLPDTATWQVVHYADGVVIYPLD